MNKLSLIVFSHSLERVHYALSLAAAAAATNRPATLFFTMGACHALRPNPTLPSTEGIDLTIPGIAQFDELLSACVELNVTFMVCEMGLKALGLTQADLRSDIPLTQGGIVTFLNDASASGAMLFI